MLARLMLLGIGLMVAVGTLGCDGELAKVLGEDAARLAVSSDGDLAAIMLQTQLQQRDQLRDGSCDTACDGVPNQDPGGAQRSGGQGGGDQLRLRDGSCGA